MKTYSLFSEFLCFLCSKKKKTISKIAVSPERIKQWNRRKVLSKKKNCVYKKFCTRKQNLTFCLVSSLMIIFLEYWSSKIAVSPEQHKSTWNLYYTGWTNKNRVLFFSSRCSNGKFVGDPKIQVQPQEATLFGCAFL